MSQKFQSSCDRILDAASNRVGEGLRVVEEIARMHLESRFLAQSLKQLRHDFYSSLQAALLTRQIVVRDSISDIGRTIETPQEYCRSQPDSFSVDDGQATEHQASRSASSMQSLVRANFKRAEQSLRTIEEIAKAVTLQVDEHDTSRPSLARQMEQIRFRIYTLEKQMLTLLVNAEVFPQPAIYVLIDGVDWNEFCPEEFSGSLGNLSLLDSQFVQTIVSLIEANVDFLQLRDKQLTDRQLIAAGKLIRQRIDAASSELKLIINDRADLAWAAGAHGVHLGQDELTVTDARKLLGQEMLIGVSTHSVEQAQQAERQGADYIGIGPVFPSSTKAFSSHIGIECVAEVCRNVSVPAFAIGGIDSKTIRQVAQAGCHRVAVSGVYRQLTTQPSEAFLKATTELRRLLSVGLDGVDEEPIDAHRDRQ